MLIEFSAPEDNIYKNPFVYRAGFLFGVDMVYYIGNYANLVICVL